LNLSINAESSQRGLITLHLKVPSTSGNFALYYQSVTSKSTLSTSGSFLIEITTYDILSLDGLGIQGLAIALIVSVGISAIPIIRRRYLIG
jgi:hypothetical protein